PSGPPPEFRVLGVKVHALQTAEAVRLLIGWLDEEPRRYRYVSSTNLHNIARAGESPAYREVMDTCDLSLPDGVPLLWFGRRRGFGELRERCGIEEIMVALFDLSEQGRDLRHYFYGNTPEVLDELRTELARRWPRLTVAGMRSPPFRKLTPDEDRADIEAIRAARPDFLWVSLGCPRQETWLFEHRDQLGPMIGGGAGAVFDFLAGKKLKAPRFVQNAGLEWMLRLASEPKRLWRRYLVLYPRYLMRLVQEEIMRPAGTPKERN
ncbi:MAG: WecB/TagA/CpsF family glycosyltransferase, partial [Candidatus Eisenbacteria bacterium]